MPVTVANSCFCLNQTCSKMFCEDMKIAFALCSIIYIWKKTGLTMRTPPMTSQCVFHFQISCFGAKSDFILYSWSLKWMNFIVSGQTDWHFCPPEISNARKLSTQSVCPYIFYFLVSSWGEMYLLFHALSLLSWHPGSSFSPPAT